jgi:hypothetical protein
LSLFAAGIDRAETYFWNDLNAPALSMAAVDSGRGTSRNEQSIAIHNVLPFENLAQTAELKEDESAIRNAIGDVSAGCEAANQNVPKRLRALLNRHRDEWRAFLGGLAADSWIRQLAGVS